MKDLIRAYIRSQSKPTTIDICNAIPGYSGNSITKGLARLEGEGRIRKVEEGPTYYWCNVDIKYHTT